MPIVCINRPNRTAPRHFTEKDLERIARTMVDQGHPVVAIVATILIATGTGVLVCRLSGAIQRTLGVMRIIKQIAAIFASAALTRAVLIWLSRAARIPIPGWPVFIAALTAMVLAIQALQEGVISLVDDISTIDEISETIDGWCQAVTDRIGLT